jgi:hypothetical protein
MPKFRIKTLVPDPGKKIPPSLGTVSIYESTERMSISYDDGVIRVTKTPLSTLDKLGRPIQNPPPDVLEFPAIGWSWRRFPEDFEEKPASSPKEQSGKWAA